MTSSPTLAQTFHTLHAVLRAEAPPEHAAHQLGLAPARVAFYRDAVTEHVRDVLLKNFGVLARVLGAERFDALVAEYFAEVPPRAFELNENAEPFPDFLAARAAEGVHGLTEAHAELAALEWQEFAVYVSPAESPPANALSGPVLNPTLAILQLDYPVADFLDAWRSWDGHGQPPTFPTEPEPQVVFVVRHPETWNALFFPATDSRLFAFKVAHDGLQLDAAAGAAGVDLAVAEEALAEAARWGLVLLPAAPSGRPQAPLDGETPDLERPERAEGG